MLKVLLVLVGLSAATTPDRDAPSWGLVIYVDGATVFVGGPYASERECAMAAILQMRNYRQQATFRCVPNRTYRPKGGY